MPLSSRIRRVLNRRLAFILGALLVAIPVGGALLPPDTATADHISEPKWTIDRLDLFVGHYVSGTGVGCSGENIGTWPRNGFGGVIRINAYIVSSERQPNGNRPGGEPSEHFDVLVYHNYPWNGNHEENLEYGDKWRHQNLGPHSPERWQILQTELRTIMRNKGLHRIFVRVTGNESNRVLEKECIFEVLE